MPNWCQNILIIEGDPSLLRMFMEQAEDYRNKVCLSFANFIPQPEKEKNALTWNCNNWGTKWDANEPDIYDEDIDKGRLEYHFDTAWGPPIEWLEKVGPLYPALKFHLSYREEGMGFAGDCYVKDTSRNDVGREIEYDEE